MRDKTTEFQPAARVFVTNAGFHDYKKAERFGQLIPLTEKRVDLIHTDRLEAAFQYVLDQHNYDPKRDFILISGSPVLTFNIGGFLARHYGSIRVLYWEGLYGDYLQREFRFEKREGGV